MNGETEYTVENLQNLSELNRALSLIGYKFKSTGSKVSYVINDKDATTGCKIRLKKSLLYFIKKSNKMTFEYCISGCMVQATNRGVYISSKNNGEKSFSIHIKLD